MNTLVLLRPHLLGFKNRILRSGSYRQAFRSSLGLLFVLGMMALVYSVHLSFLLNLQRGGNLSVNLVENLLRFFLLGFFILLLLSSMIVALSSLYFAEDVSVFLAAPVSMVQFYFAKLVEVSVASSWIFLLFAVPAAIAHYQALHLSPMFLVIAVLAVVPFLLIPASLAILLVTIFVNLIPPYRMRDLLIVFSFLLSCGLLFAGRASPEYFDTSERGTEEILRFLSAYHDPQPWWSPARWAADLLTAYCHNQLTPVPVFLLLLLTTMCGTSGLAYLGLDLFYRRGLSLAGKSTKHAQIRSSAFAGWLARVLIPWSSQYRAMMLKEIKMFVRDTTQALQLLMLLLLTFMYLYNFRSLRSTAQFTHEGYVWWQILLALANTAFGACVLAAVATRFVFPCVSLEGRAYYLLRATPLSLEQFLWFKFLTWLWPAIVLGLILLTSGTMAIQGTLETLGTTAAVSVVLCIGLTGLAVGIGAVYARFDWESTAQVTASFGSLVYMFLSLLLIVVSMIPASFLFILSCNPEFAEQMRPMDYAFSYGASFLLLLSLNVMVARRAIAAGINTLRELC